MHLLDHPSPLILNFMRSSFFSCSLTILLTTLACSENDPGSEVAASGGAPGSGGLGNPGAGGDAQSSGGSQDNASGGAANGSGGDLSGAGGSSSGGSDPLGSGGNSGNNSAFNCPSGSETGTPNLANKTLTKIEGVPEIVNNGGFLEGPAWYDGKLYVSQVDFTGPPPSSVIFTYTPGGSFTPFINDAGTIGLAIDGNGRMYAASPKSQGVISYNANDAAAAPVDVAKMSAGKPFNSPNDITVRSDGTVYFTDPPANCGGSCAQPDVQGVYRVAPDGTINILSGIQGKPNGIALSPDETTLYVGGDMLTAYPIMADGSVGAGTTINGVMGTDGLAVDCAGNVYAALYGQSKIVAVDASGTLLDGSITINEVTNLTFGGPENKTLFVTSFGDNRGILSTVEMEIPGLPY